LELTWAQQVCWDVVSFRSDVKVKLPYFESWLCLKDSCYIRHGNLIAIYSIGVERVVKDAFTGGEVVLIALRISSIRVGYCKPEYHHRHLTKNIEIIGNCCADLI